MGKLAKAVRQKKLQYPTKVTVNLAMRERSMNSPRTLLPLFLVLLVAIGAFSKFAVIDRLTEAGAARAGLKAAEAVLAEAQSQNAGFAAVLEEYSRYSDSGLSEEEKAAVDRMEILDLLDGQLMATSRVSDVSVKGGTMTVTVSGLTLQGLSGLMRQLKDSGMVSDVQVYSAGTDSVQTGESLLAGVTMTITMAQPGKGGGAS